MEIKWNMLSKYQKDLWKRINPDLEYSKLKNTIYAPSFSKLENHVVHYALLKTYAILGIHVSIKRGYSFKQDYIFKSHIDFCTKMRSCCTNKFEENLYKFISNLIFGKCCESSKNRINIKYFTSFAEFDKGCKGKLLKDFKIITDTLIQANFQQQKIIIKSSYSNWTYYFRL